MEDNKPNKELLELKAAHYFKTNTLVHISYKNGKWMRGIILEVSADFFMLDERLNGKMPVFFLEIADIEPYKKEERING